MGEYFSGSMPKLARSLIPIADASSWYCGVVLLTLILLLAGSGRDETQNYYDRSDFTTVVTAGNQLRRPCDEIYVVGEGETLHTISDKCGDPFIVEHNPHIHDPDDVFPGLVIKITPNNHNTR
ncbi:peptidoglycan-binding LysM domain-containing protein [Striga hermonthica]|uniref:Peptidoglycan-binding LysM domain-containing protein n=1 Tax=Striga hermonthica TaxID=68872 RepID=A0A9N7MFI5_STRHE|nr:peptidoglycan-binding LysM domain-containing protein [Striga hermonthica]